MGAIDPYAGLRAFAATLNPTVVIVAGGPSVTLKQVRHIGMAKARGMCSVIAVNDAIYPCWFADALYACDNRWWAIHQGVPGYHGMKVSWEKTQFPEIVKIEKSGIEGFDETFGTIRTGSNGGYQALHLAAQWGAEKVVLVGYDYSNDGAREHWFGKHPLQMDKDSNVVLWRKYLMALTSILAKKDISVYQASYDSTIKWLPYIELDRFFDLTIKGPVPA